MSRRSDRRAKNRSDSRKKPMNTYTLKIDTLYLDCSPELDLVSYGACQDEALNNLQEDASRREQARRERYHACLRPALPLPSLPPGISFSWQPQAAHRKEPLPPASMPQLRQAASGERISPVLGRLP